MDKNIKLNCLYKINRIAKEYGRLKQVAYDSGNYTQCQEYKNTQSQLYTIKALTIAQMEKSGELIALNRAADDNGALLHTFSDPNKKYVFHCISENQERLENEIITPKHGENNTSPVSALIYNPYVKYLRKSLDKKYQEIYDGLVDMEHCFSVFQRDITTDFLYTLYQYGIHVAEDKRTLSKVILTLCTSGIRICSITILLSDFSDLSVYSDEDTGCYYLDDFSNHTYDYM